MKTAIDMLYSDLLCRVARKTYGIDTCETFQHGDPESYGKYMGGVKLCTKKFCVFVEVGSEVEMNDCVEKEFYPVTTSQTSIAIEVHSCKTPSPKFTTDAGVTLEGSFDVDISSSLGMPEKDRKILVSMFFGQSSIEVRAQPSHLVGTGKDAEMLPVSFDWA